MCLTEGFSADEGNHFLRIIGSWFGLGSRRENDAEPLTE